MHRLLVYGALVSLVTIEALAGAEQEPGKKVEIRHAFPPGVYVLKHTSTSATAVNIGGQDRKSSSSETLTWELSVARPDEREQKKASLKLLRIEVAERGDRPSSFDSDRPAAGQGETLAFVYGGLAGVPVEVTLDADDAVVEVAGLDRFWNQRAGKATTPDQKAALADASISLSDKAVEQVFRRLESMMPRGAVAVGDRWKSGWRITLPIVGEIRARYDCTLKALDQAPDGPIATIELDGGYEATSPRQATIQGVELTVTRLNVLEKARVKVNTRTGLATDDTGSVAVLANMKGKGQDGREFEATTRVTSTNQMTIRPKSPALAVKEELPLRPGPAAEVQPGPAAQAPVTAAPVVTGRALETGRATLPSPDRSGPAATGAATSGPEAAAAAYLKAWRDRDLTAMSRLAVSENRPLVDALAAQGEKHPRWRTVFGDGWRARMLQTYTGTVVKARYLSPTEALVNIGPIPGDGRLAVAIVRLEDGAWRFEDLNSVDRATFDKVPDHP